jgi:hypothetical protein
VNTQRTHESKKIRANTDGQIFTSRHEERKPLQMGVRVHEVGDVTRSENVSYECGLDAVEPDQGVSTAWRKIP